MGVSAVRFGDTLGVAGALGLDLEAETVEGVRRGARWAGFTLWPRARGRSCHVAHCYWHSRAPRCHVATAIGTLGLRAAT